MTDIPDWLKSEEAMRAEIDRQIIFGLQLYIDLEDALDEAFMLYGTGEESKWPKGILNA